VNFARKTSPREGRKGRSEMGTRQRSRHDISSFCPFGARPPVPSAVPLPCQSCRLPASTHVLLTRIQQNDRVSTSMPSLRLIRKQAKRKLCGANCHIKNAVKCHFLLDKGLFYGYIPKRELAISEGAVLRLGRLRLSVTGVEPPYDSGPSASNHSERSAGSISIGQNNSGELNPGFATDKEAL